MLLMRVAPTKTYSKIIKHIPKKSREDHHRQGQGAPRREVQVAVGQQPGGARGHRRAEAPLRGEL